MKRLIIIMAGIIIAISGYFSTVAFADEQIEESDEKEPGIRWFLPGEKSLGVGGIFKTTPYKDADDKIIPFPFISYRGKRFFFRGTTLGLKLIEWNNFELDVIGTYCFAGYDEDDSDFLKGAAGWPP